MIFQPSSASCRKLHNDTGTSSSMYHLHPSCMLSVVRNFGIAIMISTIKETVPYFPDFEGWVYAWESTHIKQTIIHAVFFFYFQKRQGVHLKKEIQVTTSKGKLRFFSICKIVWCVILACRDLGTPLLDCIL